MGGRGSNSSNAGGGGGGTGNLVAAFGNANTVFGASGQYTSSLSLAPFQTVGDYTDNNNQNLVKWQGQTDDKAASYLHKIDASDSTSMADLNQIQAASGDPYGFYNLPAQRFISNMGLNAQTTVLSEADFNNYVQQTGSTVLYRGWSNGAGSVTKFNTAVNNHVGNGISGDGHYFAPSVSTAQNYGSVITKAALSPNARVVSLQDVRAQINKSSGKLRGALSKAGSLGSRTYGPNQGEMQMALKMGFNTIDAGWAVVPITRDAVVVSAKRVR